jgi:hypothetical protein
MSGSENTAGVTMIKPSELNKQIVALSAQRKENFMELANSLQMLKDLSPSAFRATVAKAGLDLRQAYYFCEIAERLRPFARYKARIEAIGWTKAQIISKHIDKANAKELLELAENKENTARKLQALMRKERLPSKMRCVQLYFSQQDYKHFESAVLQNGGSKSGRGLLNKEKAMINLIKQANVGG